MWYVIQVINGREDIMRERIEHVVPSDAMQELFYPQFQTEIKVHGEWVITTKSLFPGYLICDTADPRYRATVSATHGRLCPGAFPGRSVCAAGKRRGSAYLRFYA